MTKEKYSDRPDLQTLATTLQKLQAHAKKHGVSTIAIPKIGCGLDQMNWQDVVKLLRNIFASSDIQIVVYSLDEHAIHAMSAEGDPEFYAKNKIDRYSEEFHLNERELKPTSLVTRSLVNQIAMSNFPFYARKKKTKLLLGTTFSISLKR